MSTELWRRSIPADFEFLIHFSLTKKGRPRLFFAFIASICCLASRRTDDPRGPASPQDAISAGTQWFELLGRLHILPIADGPTPS
ncbi:hypothetical protein K438DRAFT_601792 [Mycena galopus ATCC 62051]|nr:hypothetical protein K438DRAFT_601792 [Mycena galopus ATCC 62051]